VKEAQIFIYGYYGWRNTGDDAMVYVLLQELPRLYPNAKFAVLSRMAVLIPPSAKDKVRFIKLNPFSVLREISRSSIFIIGGGTHIYDYGVTRRNLRILSRLWLILLLAKALGNRIYLLGNGIGPLSTKWGKALARLICRLADHITVRDTASYTVLENLGLAKRTSLGFDLSALLEPEPAASSGTSRQDRRILGISVAPVYETYQGNKKRDSLLVDLISQGISQEFSQKSPWEVWLFTFKGKSRFDDFAITQMLQDKLKPLKYTKLIPYNPDPRQMLAQVSQCHAFIGMRYHACLFAYLGNVPLLIIDYHPKCQALAEEIKLAANGVISLPEIMERQFAERLSHLMHSPDKFRAELSLNKAKARANAALKGIKEEKG
jgi:polysaccharide pyruvyl transferase CsaB